MGGFGASFLDSYMKAFQTGMERKRMETEQQQFKDRLQWEQAKQAQDLGLRQQEAAQQQAYQNAMLGIQQRQLDEATRNRELQELGRLGQQIEKFGEKGVTVPEFKRRQETVTMGATPTPAAIGSQYNLPPELQQAIQRGDTLVEPAQRVFQRRVSPTSQTAAEYQPPTGLDLGEGPAVPAMPTQTFQTAVSPEIQRQIFMQPDVTQPALFSRNVGMEDILKQYGTLSKQPFTPVEAYTKTPFAVKEEEETAKKGPLVDTPKGISDYFPGMPSKIRQSDIFEYQKLQKELEFKQSEAKDKLDALKENMDLRRLIAQQAVDRQTEASASRERAAVDRAWGVYGKDLNKTYEGLTTHLQSLGTALDQVNSPNAIAQGMTAPTALKGMLTSEGTAGGIRITKPELSAIIGARGVTGDVEALWNKIVNGGVFSKEQLSQLKDVLTAAKVKSEKRQDILYDTKRRASLAATENEAKQIIADGEKALHDFDRTYVSQNPWDAIQKELGKKD